MRESYKYGCRRCFCEDCGQEMIHRDRRKMYESASALGQIIHREGPSEIAVMDVDVVTAKFSRGRLLWLEQKNVDQKLGGAQNGILKLWDEVMKSAVASPSERLRTLLASYSRSFTAENASLDPESGVYVLRGQVGQRETNNPHKETDFLSPQVLTRIGGSAPVPGIKSRKNLYDWINGGDDWSPRNSEARRWK